MGSSGACPIERRQFDQMAAKSRKRVYRLAYRLSGNRNDAEDLTQEAYVRAYRNLDKFKASRPFENWVMKIVTRLFLDLVRYRNRRVKTTSLIHDSAACDEVMGLQVADARPTPDSELMNGELSEEMTRALRRLTPDQRTLIILAHFEGVAYKEIAVIFDAPIGTIRSRLHRTHRFLRKTLEEIRGATEAGIGSQGFAAR